MTEQTTVMIVEDDPVSREVVAHLLRRREYQVIEAADGREALELLSPEVKIVVADWMMPNLDGLELCRRLKSPDLAGYRYVIMVTSKAEKEDIVEALEAGADDYVIKPVDHDELLARIRAGERIVQLERSLADAWEKAQGEAERDGLTGLYNRRHFDERLAGELRRAERERSRVALLMLDLDHFKHINDTYGHAAGDEVLRHVAKIIAHEVRVGTDVPARYGGEEFAVIAPEKGPIGGEEFAVIAPDTNLFGAESLAERIRTRIAGLRVPVGDQLVSVTVSVGVAVFDPRATTRDEPTRALVEAADQRLYQAKQGGRNRVAA